MIKEILTNTGPKILKDLRNSDVNFIKDCSNFSFHSFGNLNKDKIFYIIRRYPSAGFFSNITFILNHLKICEKMKFIPIIDMENYPTLYNEKNKIKKTNNSWEYYFKNLNKYNLNKVYKSKNVFLSNLKFERDMHLDMTNIEISEYLKKIKIKESIISKVKAFQKRNFKKEKKILGVHFRGSTYKTARGHAFPLTVELMIENIKNLIKNYNYEKIFVVTEEEKYLEILKNTFGNKLFFYNSFRMKFLDSFDIYPRKNHRYLLGEEILIESLLLSKCDGLTYIKSNVISAAIEFSKKNQIKLHEVFLGLNSRNRFIAKYLWYIRSMLPKDFGGFELKYR